MADATTSCQPYKRSKDKDGYSIIFIGRKSHRAHRYFYEKKYGRVELPLDHLCRNRWCVNVEHLEPVTVAENTRRGNSAKLSYPSVKTIREMYASGRFRQWEIGEMFGVGQDHISRIVNNKKWRVV